jgi:two-component system, chemotaxis family, protein-glutamate methylesterase/glutaminase
VATRDIVVIGASAGGIEALKAIVGSLPAEFPAAVIVVVHVSPTSPGLLPGILRRQSALPVEHAEDGMALEAGRIRVAPPDHHVVLHADGIRLTRGARENMARPSVDALFRSAAVSFGPRVIGVVLTGSLDDGTAGLSAIKRCGGTAVVQDPEDAEFPSMPRSALLNVKVDHRVPLSGIAPLLTRLAGGDVQPAEPAPAAVALEDRISEMPDAAASDEEASA